MYETTVQDADPAAVQEAYDRDGFVIFRDVLDAELIGEAYRHVDWLIEHHPGVRPEALHLPLSVDDPFWCRLVSDPRLVDIAELFVGPDVALFATHYICKPPKTGQPVLWHQDGAYWPLEPMDVVTLWLAVSDSSPDNGCMRVIPGTHTMDLTALRQRTDVDNVLSSEIDDAVDESKAVDFVLKPGDVSVHHPNIVHGSEPNASDRWRRGLTLRYIPTSTRLTDPDAIAPLLVRGQPRADQTYRAMPPYVEDRQMPFAGCENWQAPAAV